MSQPPSQEAPSLKKTLGRWQVMFYGLGSMLGAGIYALIGKAAGTLGNAVWLAFLMAMVAALLTGLSYACVGSRYARAGGAAFVTQHALNLRWLSYVVGIAVMMSGLTSMATGAGTIIDNLNKGLLALNESQVPSAAFQLPREACAIAVVCIVGLVIFRGMRESMWANMVCTAVEAGGLLFIIVIGVKYWGGVNYLETALDTPGGGAGSGITLAIVMQGAVLTFFSFIGFEDILNVGEEVKNPKRDVPFGLIGAMVLATCIYMAVAITAVSVVPWRELAQSSTPLMDVAKKALNGAGGIDKVYIGIAIFAIGNTALLNYIMGSRLLYGMSHQGLLPAALGRVHPTRRTPHVAILAIFLIVALLISVGDVKQLAESTVLLLLSVFTIVNVSLVVLKIRRPEERGGFEVPIIIPALGAIVCAALVVVRFNQALASKDPKEFTALLIVMGIIAASLVLYFILKPRQVVAQVED